MSSDNTIRVLFVCTGNICRSPLAEGAFRSLLDQEGLIDKFTIDSAGTSNYHVGQLPDDRAIATAKRSGICLSHHARQFTEKDFDDFDFILVMDHLNHESVLNITKDKSKKGKVFLFRSFDESSAEFQNVPDPYYGVDEDFSDVLDIVSRSSLGFINFLRSSNLI